MSEDRDGLSRRDFLKASVVTAAAMGVGSTGVFTSAGADAIGPNDVINAAIIGTGSQGGYLLGRAVKVPNVKWSKVCDIYAPNLKRGLDIAKGATGCSDWKQVIEDKSIQAVLIATPITLHAPMVIAALKAGKHVFCEKMMAYSIEDAKRMAQTAKQTGRKLQIGHQRCYDPSYQHARKMIMDGVIGKITHVRAQWNRNASWRRPVPKDTTDQHINWRLYKKLSQGLMAELGSHQINVVNWMVGQNPSAVMGSGGINYYRDGRDVYDNVQVIFEYPNGVRCTYQSLTTNQFDGATEQIMGDKGTIILSPGKAMLYKEPKAEELIWESMAHKETSGGKTGIVLDAQKSPRLQKEAAQGTAISGAKPAVKKDDYLLELEDFFLSIRDGHEPLCSPRVALETCVPCIRANDAMDLRKRLEIPSELYKI